MVRRQQAITVAGREILPGAHRIVQLVETGLYTGTPLSVPVHVFHGKSVGPRVFITAAVHGDEIGGVEIVRRLLAIKQLNKLHGTLLVVPVANVHGFVTNSRYLPDRRDLNRSFPGSAGGSLTSRLANSLWREVIRKADYGIDLHTGSGHRINLPQIRIADDASEEMRELARTFGAPVVLAAKQREGTLRQAATQAGVGMLLYEAGEALRIHEPSAKLGRRGILAVLRAVGMLPGRRLRRTDVSPVLTSESSWARSPASGLITPRVALGEKVRKGRILADITDPVSQATTQLEAPLSGIIIGQLNLPLAHTGDAIFHIASMEPGADLAGAMESFLQEYLPAVQTYMES